MNTEDALEVAKLAAAVGGQLKNIDQFTTERTSNPANKININNFIAKVRNPNASFGPARYLTDLPSGFAAPPPEEYIQQMVPEQPSLIPQQIPLPPLQQATMATASELMPIQATLPTAVAPVENQKSSTKKQNDFNLTRGDVDSIKNSLKNIDKTLSGMLTLLQDKKKINND